jgi:hypothetical protein
MEKLRKLLLENASFLEGAGSIFDFDDRLGDSFLSSSEEESDWQVMRGDWAEVGQDLRVSLPQTVTSTQIRR